MSSDQYDSEDSLRIRLRNLPSSEAQQDAGGWVRAGILAAEKGDRRRALDCFDQAIALEPDRVEAWLWRGGLTEDAWNSLAYLERAAELAPNDQRVQEGLAWARRRVEQLEQAGASPAQRKYPTGPLSWQNPPQRKHPTGPLVWPTAPERKPPTGPLRGATPPEKIPPKITMPGAAASTPPTGEVSPKTTAPPARVQSSRPAEPAAGSPMPARPVSPQPTPVTDSPPSAPAIPRSSRPAKRKSPPPPVVSRTVLRPSRPAWLSLQGLLMIAALLLVLLFLANHTLGALGNILGNLPNPAPMPTRLIGTPTLKPEATRSPTPTFSPTPVPTPTPRSVEAQIAGLSHQLDMAWAAEDWPVVINLITQIRQLSPGKPEWTEKLFAAHYNFAQKLLRDNNPREAATQLEAASALHPTDTALKTQATLARAYANGETAYDQNQWPEAIRQFNTVYTARSDYLNVLSLLFTAHYNYARQLEDEGKLNEARDHYDAVLNLNPQMAEARDGLVRVVDKMPVGKKRIKVDLSEQRLYAYDGDRQVFKFVVSTGAGVTATRTGNFRILDKYPMGEGTSLGLRYPYWMGIYWADALENGFHALPISTRTGKVLWGGYLGRPVSFGCIVLDTRDAETLYNWAEIGTPVQIVP